MAEYNASDRKSIRAAEKAAAIAERQHREVVIDSMATPQRRQYVWEKLAAANIFATTFSTDPLQMAFNEGQRNQGLVLLNDVIEHCPEQFIEAMRESNERRSRSHGTDGNGSARGGQRSSGPDGDGGVEGQPLSEDAGDAGNEAIDGLGGQGFH